MNNDLATTTDAPTTLSESVRRALARGHTIDITTTGRRTGSARRIEIVFHNIDGRIYITGLPRRETRAWLHNLRADPHLVIHLKGSLKADLSATAREITDETERRAVFEWVVKHAWRQNDPATMTRYSPLVEVQVEGLAA